jgi:hypothetical protein
MLNRTKQIWRVRIEPWFSEEARSRCSSALSGESLRQRQGGTGRRGAAHCPRRSMQPCSSTSTAESRQRRNLSRFPSSVCHLEHLVDAHLSATERDRGEEHDAGERERRMLTTQPGKSTYASAEEVGLALMSPLHLLHPLPTGASATEISSSSRSEVAAKARRRCPAPCGRRAHRRTVASVHGTQPLHPFLFFLLPLPGHRRSPGLSSRRCRSSRLYAPHRRSSRLSGLRRCCSLLLVVAVVRITRRTRFYRILTDG